MNQNRYPGVKPFEKSEREIFFGRSQDIEDLHELILLEKLIVLFGKSGYGKSSLINAGILPRFEETPKGSSDYFLPITIRFGAYTLGEKILSPVEIVRRRLEEILEPITEMDFIQKLNETDLLWKDFKRRQSAKHKRFLLIFDQFEELFTYPSDQQNNFKNQLAELLFSAIPQPIRNVSENISEEDYNRLVDRLEVKALFSIRSDQLALLDRMKDSMPLIMSNLYELKALQRKEAREAIVKPASLPNSDQSNFSTNPFLYSPNALQDILDSLLSINNTQTQNGIEAFQLQIICQHIERAIINGQIKEKDEHGVIEVTRDQLPDLSNIYEDYYRQKIMLLPVTNRDAAKLILEEGLLFLNEENNEARRLSVDGGALIDRYRYLKVDEFLLNKLVDVFLLRRERNNIGGYNYEITHDTLLKPIIHSRKKRERELEILETENRRLAAEAKAVEEERKRKEADSLRRKAEIDRQRAITLLIIVCIIGFFAFFYWRKSKLTQDELDQLNIVRARIEIESLIQRAADLEGLYPNSACELYKKADSIYQINAKSPVFYDTKNILQGKLTLCN